MVATALESCPKCPKCDAPRSSGRACARCGLATDLMAAYADKREASVPDAVGAAWDHTVADWSDAARHDALFGLVAHHGVYAWAAGKYRDRQRASGDDDPVAAHQLGRLRRAIEATMLATATARADQTPAPYRAFLAVLLILAFATAAAIVLAMMLKKPAAPSGATRAPHPAAPAPGGGAR